MKIAELVKTYRVINDPNAPQWSIRFVGALAIAALVAAGGGSILWASQNEASSSGEFASATLRENADGTRTDYVGYVPGARESLAMVDPAAIEGMMQAWEAEHPDAAIVSKTPVFTGGQLTGWQITYHE